MSRPNFADALKAFRAREIRDQPMALPEKLPPARLPARATPGAQKLVLSLLQDYCHVLYAHADVARKQRVGADLTVIVADYACAGGRVTVLHRL